MDAEIIIWLIIFLGGYIGILAYFIRCALCCTGWK